MIDCTSIQIFDIGGLFAVITVTSVIDCILLKLHIRQLRRQSPLQIYNLQFTLKVFQCVRTRLKKEGETAGAGGFDPKHVKNSKNHE